jgi:hypothetical protein
VRAILAGQPADAQVTGVRVTVYGIEGSAVHNDGARGDELPPQAAPTA